MDYENNYKFDDTIKIDDIIKINNITDDIINNDNIVNEVNDINKINCNINTNNQVENIFSTWNHVDELFNIKLNESETMVDISQYFHLPLKEAAKVLGSSPQTICRITRKVTKQRWAYRKLVKIDKILKMFLCQDNLTQEQINMFLNLINERAKLCAPAKVIIRKCSRKSKECQLIPLEKDL